MRRVGFYDEVRQLHDQGRSARQIARTLHLARNTVRRFLRAESFPERQPRPTRRTLLTPYEPYLRERFAAGCHSATALWREVQARGVIFRDKLSLKITGDCIHDGRVVIAPDVLDVGSSREDTVTVPQTHRVAG